MTSHAPTIVSRAAASLFTLLVITGGGATPLSAQERVRPFDEGDGRIHGAPVLQVTEQDLHPGQVQTINLLPGYHTILEFPYPIASVHAGDPDVFLASIVGNKLSLKATRLTRSETNMSVILADADLTLVPFLIRADSTQPPLYVVRYTDPVAKHLNDAEERIAERVTANNDERVEELAQMRLEQQLLWAGDVVEIDKTATVGGQGERTTLRIESAQEIRDESGARKLYLRYKIFNQSYAPIEDLHFVVRKVTHGRKLLVFNSRTEHELYDVRDMRTSDVVGPGAAARGVLVFDFPELTEDQSLEVEAIAFNGQRHITIERVLVGK